ncbi:hypothetical protein ACLESD_51640, partial [Pyxidicoccus sp. 3LFB2]
MSGHLSQWELDALALSALAPDAAAVAEAHLKACVRCQEALASLRATHRRFETDVLPRTPAPAARPGGRRELPPTLGVAAG